MRSFGLILFIVVALGIDVEAQKTVWVSEDLKKVEIDSWFDIFSMSTNWVNASNDDASIQRSMNGLAGPGGAWWPIYLNGIKLNTQAWDSQSLHLIPITLSQADSVVIIEQPMLYKGVFTEKGAIFIYGTKIQDGWNIQGNLSFGNRSGDPGPYVYTKYASENIERVGPITDANISYKANNLGLRAGGSLSYHALTDNDLAYRRLVPFRYGGHPYRQVKIINKSGFLEAELKTDDRTTYNLFLSSNFAEDYLFSNIYGVETPVERNVTAASLSGETKLIKKLNFLYQVSHNTHNTRNYPNKENHWLEWKQGVTSGKVYAQHLFRRGFQEFGIDTDYFHLQNEFSEVAINQQLFGSFYSIEYQLNKMFKIQYNGKLVFAEQLAIKNNPSLQFQIAPKNYIELSGTYSERLPIEDNSMWYWITNKGFAMDTINTESLMPLPYNIVYKQLKLSWKYSFNNTEVLFSPQLIKNQNEYIVDYSLSGAGKSTEIGLINYLNNYNASYYRLPLRVKSSYLSNIFQSIGYTFTKQLNSSAEITQIPAHRLQYYLNWKPVDSFKIWFRIQGQSSIAWKSIESIDGREVVWVGSGRFEGGEVRSTYHADTDARFTVDFGIKKYFWEQRIAFSLDMRNVTDQHYKYHPLSQTHRLSLFLKAHLDLSSRN